MMLQQLQELQQPSKHRPIYKKTKKNCSQFLKNLKYSMKLHKIPVSFEVWSIFCTNFSHLQQLYGLQQLRSLLKLQGSGHIMIILYEILCIYINNLEGLIFLKASLLQFAVNLNNFVTNYCKSEATIRNNYKCCSNFIKIWKYSMKSHKSVSSEAWCIFCTNFSLLEQLYELQQLHGLQQLLGSGRIMIILNQILFMYCNTFFTS